MGYYKHRMLTGGNEDENYTPLTIIQERVEGYEKTYDNFYFIGYLVEYEFYNDPQRVVKYDNLDQLATGLINEVEYGVAQINEVEHGVAQNHVIYPVVFMNGEVNKIGRYKWVGRSNIGTVDLDKQEEIEKAQAKYQADIIAFEQDVFVAIEKLKLALDTAYLKWNRVLDKYYSDLMGDVEKALQILEESDVHRIKEEVYSDE